MAPSSGKRGLTTRCTLRRDSGAVLVGRTWPSRVVFTSIVAISMSSLVHLYAERRSPKYEKAALRWLERYLREGSPRLRRVAELTADLARLEPGGTD